MIDAPNACDLPSTTADDALIFDEVPRVDSIADVTAETGIDEPRRISRRGRTSKEASASPETVAASSMRTSSAEAAPASAEEPAGAPAPFPPLGADPAGSKSQPLLLAVVGFALLTSTVSLGGMIAMSRTLARAGADRSAAATERQALADVPALIAHIDAASARLDATAARTTPVAPAPSSTFGGAVGPADLHREIDGLKLALGQRQPEGLTALDGTTREGFSELATKLDRLSAEIDQMAKRSGGVSASRPASRAGGPARPS